MCVFFCCHPGVLSMGIILPAWKTKWFQANACHALEHPLLTHPLVCRTPVTNPVIITHTSCIQAGAGHTPWRSKIPSDDTASLSHTLSSGRVCSYSIATDVPLAHPLHITPPRYHTPSCGAPVNDTHHRGYA